MREDQPRPNTDRAEDFFLPDFCNVRMVFAVVVISELLAIVITLAPMESRAGRWVDLSIISLFVQWVGLSSAGVLCLSRTWLAGMSEYRAAAASYLLLLMTTLVISAFTLLISDYISSPDWKISFPSTDSWQVDFLLRNLVISAIVSALILRYFYIQHQWQKNVRAEALARLQALQSRIRPHFLFNSLNTIASLTQIDADQAEVAVENLADLFRNSLADASHSITLADELTLTQRYLDIEKLRLGDRLQIRWNIGELPDNAILPRLILQPLIENAIYHGIEPIKSGGAIGVDGKIYDDEIYITISNPLSKEGGQSQQQGNRIAQENIRQRLAAMYGNKGRLTVQEDASDYIITLIFPYQKQNAENRQQ